MLPILRRRQPPDAHPLSAYVGKVEGQVGNEESRLIVRDAPVAGRAKESRGHLTACGVSTASDGGDDRLVAQQAFPTARLVRRGAAFPLDEVVKDESFRIEVGLDRRPVSTSMSRFFHRAVAPCSVRSWWRPAMIYDERFMLLIPCQNEETPPAARREIS